MLKQHIPSLIFTAMILVMSCTTKNNATETVTANASAVAVENETDTSIVQTVPLEKIDTIDYDSTEWTDIAFLDSSILIDMRYATEANFVEEKMYECGRCFLRPEFAKVVVAIHQELQAKDLGLKMLDCFRPRPIQWKLWNKVPDPRYVADPRKGSMHNRGLAVDLTIVDKSGKQLEMGTHYDYFGREAYHAYTNFPDSIMNNRILLKTTMEKYGLKPTSTEWWHYSYRKKRYPLSDMLWNCEEAN